MNNRTKAISFLGTLLALKEKYSHSVEEADLRSGEINCSELGDEGLVLKVKDEEQGFELEAAIGMMPSRNSGSTDVIVRIRWLRAKGSSNGSTPNTTHYFSLTPSEVAAEERRLSPQ